MLLLKRAIEIAIEAHKGQKDRAGTPYILHPLRVMLRVESDTEMIVAVLHDVIERAKANTLSRRVKIADLRDNMDTSRLSRLTEEDLRRFERYHKAFRVMTRGLR